MPRKSASKKQRGGSLASNRVMGNLDTAAATHDYVVSPRIRTSSKLGNTETYKLTGGACGACGGHKHAEGFRGCGATAPTQSGGASCHKKEEFASCGGSTAPTQSGGARRITNKSRKSSGKNRKTLRKSSGKNRKSLRKSSGKNRKTRKTRKQRGGQDNQGEAGPQQNPPAREQNSPSKTILKRNKEHNKKENFLFFKKEKEKKKKMISFHKGGGSAWMNSQYSQTLTPASHARSSQFSSSAPASRNTLMNPPNMGLAGSGLGGTYDNHAPV